MDGGGSDGSLCRWKGSSAGWRTSPTTHPQREAFTSTTWKSLGVGFAAGFISTFAYFPLGIHLLGGLIWGASILYIGYQFYEAKKGS